MKLLKIDARSVMNKAAVDIAPAISIFQLSEEELVQRYQPMVKRVANRLSRHKPSFMDQEDLIQDGLAGLLSAVRSMGSNYKEEQFSRYAHQRVQGSIIDCFRAHSPISRSDYQKARLTQIAGKDLTASINANDLSRADEVIYSVFAGSLSIDDGFNSADSRPGPDIYADAYLTLEKVIRILESISERDRNIFVQYIIHGELQADIAKDLNISVSRVSQTIKEVREILEIALLSPKTMIVVQDRSKRPDKAIRTIRPVRKNQETVMTLIQMEDSDTEKSEIVVVIVAGHPGAVGGLRNE